ncbi:MAG: transcriptional regulator NrdR [Planctomycetaceae bacterium]|jgi:transcriptional repressor NrdR|nr:transcriptional regulator NrdR [Planctomycetaceae bacterium]
MKCPFCHKDNDKVINTRSGDDGTTVRRRRLCCHCNKRFTTYERVEMTTIRVVKRDQTRVPFDPQKIRQGIERACWKRPISDEQLNDVVASIAGDIDARYDSEVPSREIGQLVMSRLRNIDMVAYIRFASVYLEFQEARDFVKEIQPMLGLDK